MIQKLMNKPLLLSPQSLEAINALEWLPIETAASLNYELRNGVAIIPIHGLLTKRTELFSSMDILNTLQYYVIILDDVYSSVRFCVYRVILIFLVLLNFPVRCMESYVTSDFGGFSGVHISRRHFECIGSTHTYSKDTELISAEEPSEWILITTNRQTAGVGTHSRKWLSEYPGNIYANLVVPISPKGIVSLPLLPQEKIGALAVVSTFRHLLPAGTIKVKWPNDVIVNERKLCGIVAEVSKYPWQLTIGIGVNINLDSDKLRMISQPATSMRESVGREFSNEEIEDFLKSIVSNIVYMTKNSKTPEGIDIQHAFMENMEKFSGRFVSVFNDDTHQIIVGTIEGIDETGRLLLKKKDSESIIEISSGTLRSLAE